MIPEFIPALREDLCVGCRMRSYFCSREA